MGPHNSLPSRLYPLNTNASAEANTVETRILPNIPFLLKVLSIRKALAVQAHPNTELAAQLYLESDLYPGQRFFCAFLVAQKDPVNSLTFCCQIGTTSQKSLLL